MIELNLFFFFFFKTKQKKTKKHFISIWIILNFYHHQHMAFASSGQDLSYCIFVLIYSVLMEQVPGRGGIPLPERSGWSL